MVSRKSGLLIRLVSFVILSAITILAVVWVVSGSNNPDTLTQLEVFIVAFVLGDIVMSLFVAKTKDGLVFKPFRRFPVINKPEFAFFGYLSGIILESVVGVLVWAAFEITQILEAGNLLVIMLLASLTLLLLALGFLIVYSDAKPNLAPKGNDAPTAENTVEASEDPERNRFIFELINQRQAQEIQRISDIDSKANNLVGFITGITGLILGITSLSLNQIKAQPLSDSLFLFFGIGFLFAALVAGLLAQRVQRWQLVPSTMRLIEAYWNRPVSEVMTMVTGEMARATAEIEPRNNSKAGWVERGWYLGLIGLLLILLYIVAVVL